MADRYQSFTQSAPGRLISKQLGLPAPPKLRRYEPGQPLLDAPALLGAAEGGRLLQPAAGVLSAAGAEAHVLERGPAQTAATEAGLETSVTTPDSDGDVRFGALLFDASGIASTGGLRELYDFFHPIIRQIGPSGRVVVLATP